MLLSLTIDMSSHFSLCSDYQGEVEISILGLSVTTDMIVAQNNRGDLLVSVQNCQLSTGNIEVQLNSEER